ncbi:MAG: sodium:alanine symporter [Bdellovibrionaceae bacterium]|nr:sodium:alanine symporter [Pseudobdellovibrionaceae bacterium]
MESIVSSINSVIWSPALIYLCLGAGLFYSITTRFLQVRHFKEMWRLILKGESSEHGISSFQALAVSLSGRVGTGNIAGVAAAIGFGGPGAVFWMWVVAFLGSATAYVESTLGQIYKEDFEGSYRGGPAYYIENLLGWKWYSFIFALATVLACGLLLPTVQSNSIGNAVAQALGDGSQINSFFGVLSSTKVFTAITIVVLLGFIVFGGLKRIANFTQVIVPFMALAYILIALSIIVLNLDKLPGVISLIIGDAFTPMAGFGAAIGWGVKRGVYSNEAGQGTGPHAAAAAEVDHPAQQGLVQAFSVYIDTLFLCSATAFMILIGGTYNVQGPNESLIVENVAANTEIASPAFTQMAVDSVLTGFGDIFVALALFFFAFTTLLAYYFIAEVNLAYLRKHFKIPFNDTALKIVIVSAAFYGTVKDASLAWGMGDIGVGLMAWLNIAAILVIFFKGKPALLALKDYEEQIKENPDKISFDPKKLGISKAKFWEK